MNGRTLAFVVVGAFGFLVQVIVMAAITFGAHWPAAFASALGVEAALLTNFVWHERWTWRDRTMDHTTRWQRLMRFHVSNGVASILGNVAVTMGIVGVFHLNPVMANVIAVPLLSVVNYVAADRWVFGRRASIAVVSMMLLSSSPAHAGELRPETLAAWNQHVGQVEASLSQHERDAPITVPAGHMIDVPNGTIHEWRGSITIPHTTVNQLVDALLSPGAKPLQEDVAESRVLERHGDALHMYFKLVRRVIVTVTYDTEHDIRYVRRSPTFATSRSVSTKIVESGGSDRGFLWRLNSYWRYRQVGDAVQVDILSLSLSRDVPWVVRPIARPLIDRIGRESMTRTLVTVQRRADAMPARTAAMPVRSTGH